MNEETTNLETTMDPAEGEDLFTDDSQPQEEATGEGMEQNQQEEEDPQESSQGLAEPTYKVKYNGQEQELPVSQLVTLAQKGMNYDKVSQALNALKSSPEMQLMEEMARRHGMSREQYVAAVRKNMEQQAIQEQVSKGIPEEVARRLSALEAEKRQREQMDQQMRIQSMRKNQMLELAREYPNIKEFPQEVLEAIQKGETPLNAYRAYDLRETKKQLEITKKNQENREKTSGSANSTQGKEEHDLFLDGFFSV